MIRFEHGMLVLDNTATKDDVNAVNEFAEFVRNEERERIIKLLEQGAEKYQHLAGQAPTFVDGIPLRGMAAGFRQAIALIKGENK